jgi:desampylase
VQLAQAALRILQSASLRAYPEEACGFLIGPRGTDDVDEARACPNLAPGPRVAAYLIEPLAYVRLEDELEGGARRLQGIFHSHPGAAATPSAVDADRALPDLLYLIQTVDPPGRLGALRAWRLVDERFLAVPLPVEPDLVQAPSAPPRTGSDAAAPTR